MYVPKTLLILLMVVAASGGAWLSAQPTTNTLSAQDLHELQLLVQGYHRGIDIGPEDASWVFAEDAVFEYTAGAVRGASVSGADALKEFYAGLRKTNTSRHLVSNVVIEPAPGGGATGSLYMTTLDRTDDSPVTVTGFGLYEDVYVKTAGGWRIKHRTYTQQMPAAPTQ